MKKLDEMVLKRMFWCFESASETEQEVKQIVEGLLKRLTHLLKHLDLESLENHSFGIRFMTEFSANKKLSIFFMTESNFFYQEKIHVKGDILQKKTILGRLLSPTAFITESKVSESYFSNINNHKSCEAQVSLLQNK